MRYLILNVVSRNKKGLSFDKMIQLLAKNLNLMPTIDPNKFGPIEKISANFLAYYNWPDTRITPFSKEDVLTAVKLGVFEKRSFQDDSARKELDEYKDKLSDAGTSKEQKDQKLAEWARNFHIARVAYLCSEFPDDPIKVTADLSDVTDGAHRVMAAIALEKNAIEYIIDDTNKQSH